MLDDHADNRHDGDRGVRQGCSGGWTGLDEKQAKHAEIGVFYLYGNIVCCTITTLAGFVAFPYQWRVFKASLTVYVALIYRPSVLGQYPSEGILTFENSMSYL